MSEDVPSRTLLLSETLPRIAARWLILGAAVLYGLSFFGFAAYGMIHEEWVEDMAKQHFAATVGLPCAALAAMLLVTVFEIHTGPVEFKLAGVEFKGAAGQVAMWVLCFLSMALAIRLLW